MLLLAALIGYYSTYRVIDGNVDLIVVAFWVAAALTAGPLLAALVTHATRSGWAGAVAVAFPAGLLLGEAARASTMAVDGGSSAHGFWALAAFDLVAGILVLLRLPHRARTRTATLALLPVFAAGGFLMSALPRWFVVFVIGAP